MTAMVTAGSGTGIALRRIPLALLAAAVLAATANSLVRLLALAFADVDPDFRPLQPGAPVFMSVLSAVGAAVVLAALVRWTSQPERNFLRVSGAVFVLTFLPLVGIATDATPPPEMAGADGPAVTALAIMHVVALVTIVPTLLRLSRTR